MINTHQQDAAWRGKPLQHLHAALLRQFTDVLNIVQTYFIFGQTIPSNVVRSGFTRHCISKSEKSNKPNLSRSELLHLPVARFHAAGRSQTNAVHPKQMTDTKTYANLTCKSASSIVISGAQHTTDQCRAPRRTYLLAKKLSGSWQEASSVLITTVSTTRGQQGFQVQICLYPEINLISASVQPIRPLLEHNIWLNS